VIAAV